MQSSNTSAASGSRKGKKIGVNSASVCRRKCGPEGNRYGGSRRMSSGKKPNSSKENSKPAKKTKRTRNQMDNVYANQQNGKSHGDGH